VFWAGAVNVNTVNWHRDGDCYIHALYIGGHGFTDGNTVYPEFNLGFGGRTCGGSLYVGHDAVHGVTPFHGGTRHSMVTFSKKWTELSLKGNYVNQPQNVEHFCATFFDDI